MCTSGFSAFPDIFVANSLDLKNDMGMGMGRVLNRCSIFGRHVTINVANLTDHESWDSVCILFAFW